MSDRHKHGDPLLVYASRDGLEEDREHLRRAVDEREMCHPFTTSRFQGLGWAKPSRSANFFSNLPIPHQLTQKGVDALDVARKVHNEKTRSDTDRDYLLARERRQPFPEYRR